VKLLQPPAGLSAELRLEGRPSVLLIAGVNGAGKTTTIGKLAAKLGGEGACAVLGGKAGSR
jgi:fused signal recognition particle receptor